MFILENVKYKNILNIENLIIPTDKITGIIGKSGSGKTTLLKLLNNMNTCDSGKIFYKKKDIYEIDPVILRRNVLMLSQEPTIFEGNIRDNLNMGLKFSNKNIANDEKLKEILKLIRLDKNLDKNVNELSGGEKQRICLGRIILLSPEVFLLDEPSSALDETTADEVLDVFINYCKMNKKGVIMVTHSKKIADKYCEYQIEISQNTTNLIKGE